MTASPLRGDFAGERGPHRQRVTARFNWQPADAPAFGAALENFAAALELPAEFTLEKTGHTDDFAGRGGNLRVQGDDLGVEWVRRGRHPRNGDLHPFVHLGFGVGKHQVERRGGVVRGGRGPRQGNGQNEHTQELAELRGESQRDREESFRLHAEG